MVFPSLSEVKDLAREYRVIPICSELYADIITPIALLRKLAARSGKYFLLESVEGGERWGRYTFLGFNPAARVTYRKGEYTLYDEDGTVTATRTDTPFEMLREFMARYRAPKLPGMPPFTGGLVGYYGYAVAGVSEPSLKLSGGGVNDFDLMLFDKVIAYDHLRQKLTLIDNMKTQDVQSGWDTAMRNISALKALITDALPPPEETPQNAPEFTCDADKERFCEMVDTVKSHIVEGDIFQAVLSRRFTCQYQGSLQNAYRVLRTTNPSPYMVCMSTGELELMAASPETLVRLQDGKLSTFPVAGSRPRGKTPAEDEALEKELLADQKELSEHNMLVDLARNDLGRVSEYGTVRVSEYKLVHRYSRIMHITSVVESRLKENLDAFDALRALLPAGTLSGAPKIRAMQIIDKLEGSPRGVYGGAIGYVDFCGDMDTCIAIRMAVKRGNTVTVQAGCGIVADSVPETEYEESAHKAEAVIDAIKRAGEVTEL
ncbi:MAG: chorismate-binding protein [Oscillospiraceae bacterium]|nr:chorismate-binding protein [Oscillospiraceae bacterium]